MIGRLLPLIGFVVVTLPLQGQTQEDRWVGPRTAFGQPDLQGVWLNRSAAPLERPKELQGRTALTDAEVAEFRRRADRLFKYGHNDYAAGDNLFRAVLTNPEHYKSQTATGTSEDMVPWEFDNRTSLITDPPDGRIPPYTLEGQRRQTAAAEAAAGSNFPAGPQDLTPSQRCITFGVPRLGGTFSSGQYAYMQIVQAPGYVVLFFETIHDARIIPLDGRPHLPQNVRTWNGDSRGHWEGGTLVVDTTNFSTHSNFLGSAENLHLIERFTRIAPQEIRYELTIDDATTWTRPWSAMIRLKLTEEKLYEFACHEGNAQTEAGMLLRAHAEQKAAGASSEPH
ncbi:MAG TPA: hypothetical protein VKX49_18655 [Bryobacteraceae bacterium]|nr:hypothetical protein [Bryobacteraceae bacterium]